MIAYAKVRLLQTSTIDPDPWIGQFGAKTDIEVAIWADSLLTLWMHKFSYYYLFDREIQKHSCSYIIVIVVTLGWLLAKVNSSFADNLPDQIHMEYRISIKSLTLQIFVTSIVGISLFHMDLTYFKVCFVRLIM